MTLSGNTPSANKLLGALSTKGLKQLSPNLESVPLDRGHILYYPKQAIEYVYFPYHAAISMVNIFKNGATVEVGLIGAEGMLGTSLLSGDDLSPHQAIVQVADGGWRMKTSNFRQHLEESGEFDDLVRRYAQALFVQVAQTASCNRMHPIVERLARWLLLTQDRMESDTLNLTHEFIATMLGSRRAGVSVAAGVLQSAGLIDYHRGTVNILDRSKLEEASCECHRVVTAEYDRLLGKAKRSQ